MFMFFSVINEKKLNDVGVPVWIKIQYEMGLKCMCIK